MVDNDSWPYVTQHHPIESGLHIQLKNLAVYWLQQRGFNLSDIEDEYYLGERFDSHAYTDIYANDDDREIFIECETESGNLTNSNYSRGGKVPARAGEKVLYFSPAGIFELKHVQKELQHRSRDETTWMKVFKIQSVSGLPLLDLRAFSDG